MDLTDVLNTELDGLLDMNEIEDVQKEQSGDFIRMMDRRLNGKKCTHRVGNDHDIFVAGKQIFQCGSDLCFPFCHRAVAEIFHTTAVSVK